MPKILIVEDDADLAMGLEDDLRAEGYEVATERNGLSAAVRAREPAWDLILLDVMLPGKDGLEICRELRRARVRTPIIMLTARAEESDKVLGLEYGADDYVTKPFSPRELRARVRAVMRRFEPDGRGSCRLGETEIDFDRAEVRRGDTCAELTPLECKLLQVFLRSSGRLLSRDALIEQAWGRGTHISDRAVDQHIVNLRRKIEPDAAAPRHIVSVRGLGYRFDT